MKNNGWIPVSSGLFPEEKEIVQVTFIGFNDGKPYCDEFAYIENGSWHWVYDSDDEVRVKITAWKYNCKPYMGE